MIKVQAGSSFVEENSNSLDEKNVGKESFEPVDDGRNPWRGGGGGRGQGQSPSSRDLWLLTKLDFWKGNIHIDTVFSIFIII